MLDNESIKGVGLVGYIYIYIYDLAFCSNLVPYSVLP